MFLTIPIMLPVTTNVVFYGCFTPSRPRTFEVCWTYDWLLAYPGHCRQFGESETLFLWLGVWLALLDFWVCRKKSENRVYLKHLWFMFKIAIGGNTIWDTLAWKSDWLFHHWGINLNIPWHYPVPRLTCLPWHGASWGHFPLRLPKTFGDGYAMVCPLFDLSISIEEQAH